MRSIFDKFRARALQHPQIQTPCVYRIEFHLLNEREIKTIRPRVHQLAKPLASSRARSGTLWFSLSASLTQRPPFDSNVSFNFFARFFLFLTDTSPSSFSVPLLHSPPPPSPSPNPRVASVLSPSAGRRKDRERNHLPSSLSSYPFASSPFCALHRSCAHALPCFSRHFSPSRRVGVRLILALPGLFRLFLLHRRNIEIAPRIAGLPNSREATRSSR